MVSFWPWRNDDTSPASFEKTLSALSAKITSTQATLDKTRAKARRVKVLWVLYLGFAYLVYAIIQLVVVGYQNMGPAEWAGLAGGPVFIIITRKLIGAFFDFRITSLSKRLQDYQQERAKTIQKLKDATKYDSTMQLIEKYGGEKRKEAGGAGDGKDPNNSNQRQPHQGGGQPQGGQNRTRMPPPPTANIQPRPLPGQQQQQQPPPPQQGPSQSPSPNSLEPGAEFAPNAFSDSHHSHAIDGVSQRQQQQQQQQGYASIVSPPAESHWYDRIFDVLLGEDETAPKNRIVLICQVCRLVNGQAPPGTRTLGELGMWRCMACHAQNGQENDDELPPSEGKRIVEEVLASNRDDVDDAKEDKAVKEEEEEEEAGGEAVDVGGGHGDKESLSTGVESHQGAKKRRSKGK